MCYLDNNQPGTHRKIYKKICSMCIYYFQLKKPSTSFIYDLFQFRKPLPAFRVELLFKEGSYKCQ